MFNFFDMADTYKQRTVANFTKDSLVVDTVRVNDSRLPYETGVQHPDYNDGKWVIVGCYWTKEEAQVGHDKWVKIMTTDPLPTELKDVSTAQIAELSDLAHGEEDWRTKPRTL